MPLLSAQSIHELYLKTLSFVLREGFKTSPRGQPTYEVRNCLMTLKEPTVEAPITEDPKRNQTLQAYAAKELKLYKKGELSAEVWAKEGAAFWAELANPDGTINSNYGALTTHERSARATFEGDIARRITQWDWARRILLLDKDSRQAVMHFNQPQHQWFGNKDFPCTLTGTFHIREGLLHYSVVMRSQDMVLGWPYDMFYFAWQLHSMAVDLHVDVGTLSLFVHSLHVYDRDLDTVLRMTGDQPNADC